MKELFRAFHIKTKNTIKNFSMDIDAGETMLLLGNCDSGKEQVRDVLIGRNTDYAGSLFLCEKKLDKYKEFQARRMHGIFYANVNETLVPTMSIAENMYVIRDGKQGLLLPKRIINIQTEKILKDVDLNLSPNDKIKKLSYFHKLVLCIAKAVTYDSKLIIFECSAHQVSYRELKKLKKILDQYKEKQISFLIISEKPDEILELVDRITVIKNGIDKKVAFVSDVSRRDLLTYMFGTEFSVEPLSKNAVKNVMLELQDENSKKINDKTFYEPLGIFDTQWGQYENAMQYIQNFFENNKITLAVNQEPISIQNFSPSHVYKNGIVFIDEKSEDHLFSNFDLRGNLVIPRQPRELFGIIHKHIEEYAEREFYEKFDFLKDNSYTYSDTLIKKLVSIYRWERYKPKLIILDSPVGNLDITEISIIQKYLQSLIESGIGVIVMCRQLINQQLLCGEIICAIDKKFKGIYQADSIDKDYIFFMEEN